MAVAIARDRGFAINQKLFDRQIERMSTLSTSAYADTLQGDSGINGTFGRSYMLLGLAAAGHPRDDTTDAIAYYIAGNASDHGPWHSESHRPPLEDTPVTSTAIASRVLTLYGVEARSSEIEAKTALAHDWLDAYEPTSNEERAMRLFGIGWSGGSPESIENAAVDLLNEQREDGGWSQLPDRDSDAYATGQSLVALQQIGGLPVESAAYRRGVQYLLNTQRTDGSWLVPTRRFAPGLPYFETGFPHGEDQFISFAATAWATMALCMAVDPEPSPVFRGPPVGRNTADSFAKQSGMLPLHIAAAFGTVEDLRASLDDHEESVNVGGPGGLTPLMLAVHDVRKVEMLLAAGADAEAESELGNSPLVLAGWYGGAADSLDALLNHDNNGANRAKALLFATRTGDKRKVARLLDLGVPIESEMPGGISSLLIAEFVWNLELMELLLDRGADINAALPDGATLLMLAAMDGWVDGLQLLIDRNASINAANPEGMTALTWAAIANHGHDRIARMLLDAGADPTLKDNEGKTPFDHAVERDNQSVRQLLRSIPTTR